MNETIIDRTYVCLKLIDMLYKKGLINEATYFKCETNLSEQVVFLRWVVKDVSPVSISLQIKDF